MGRPSLLVGTGNRHKLAEIREILGHLPVPVRGADALPVPVTVAESGGTFEENARLKALAFARAAGGLPARDRPRWVLAEDSGLCVDALGGAPGVRSARYGGEQASSAERNRLLLAELSGVPPPRRGAVFVCVAACAEVPAGSKGEARVIFVARGECRGRIAEAPRGAGGFGYDPLFLLPERGKTYAELDQKEKNRISHRSRALAAFADQLRTLLSSTSEHAEEARTSANRASPD